MVESIQINPLYWGARATSLTYSGRLVAEIGGLDFLVPSMGSGALLGQLGRVSVLYWSSLR